MELFSPFKPIQEFLYLSQKIADSPEHALLPNTTANMNVGEDADHNVDF